MNHDSFYIWLMSKHHWALENNKEVMLPFTFVLAAVALAAAALPADMPEPGELAFVLNEEDFEDYLDTWLANEQQNQLNKSSAFVEPRNGKYFFYDYAVLI